MLYELYRSDSPGWDEMEACVVRAKSAAEARKLANEKCGDEGCIWDDAKLVKCVRLNESGRSKVILVSRRDG